eukprot:TRINITY_DN3253_c0_g1_i1.p1 TRINITY_DN3253_c0_g1~~TRINITY_DN3253_c0_g1_i1.p1  ORF type:complete len:947 (-),score=227.69 TRINITY_DN3253_c0_g1_i1:424-3264(-)
MLIFFLLCILSYAPQQLTCNPTPFYHRRILHQPFFPLEDSPPSSSSTPEPKLPSSTNPPPFFPSYPFPPPPPLASFVTFPANISSLAIPQNPSKNPISPRILIPIIISLIFVLFFVSFTLFLYYRRRKLVQKSSRSDTHRLFSPEGGVDSDGRKMGVSTTSSEFLYMGTMVNSRSVEDGGDSGNAARNSPYRKLSSPELHPLPPLTMHFRQNCEGNDSVVGSEEEEEEEFFSPRGSSGSKASPTATGSSSRRADPVAAAEEQGVGWLNSSRSDSASFSASPPSPYASRGFSPPWPMNHPLQGSSRSPSRRSLSSFSSDSSKCPSPMASTSPERPNIESSNSPTYCIAGDAGPLRPPPPPPPPPPRRFTPSPPKRNPPPLPSASLSLGKDLDKITASGARIQDISGQIQPFPLEKGGLSGRPFSNLPPPRAPPPPPAGFWDTPTPPPPIQWPGSRPPVLVTPTRAVEFKNQRGISPEQVRENSDSVERKDDTPMLKLKPLHWDKVRTSSDRAMVWDQLKSSSFKLNEEMIETLFVCNPTNLTPKEMTRRMVLPSPNQENTVLDPKKSQNIAILLRALNVTKEEVCEALLEGNADSLGVELLETLSKMAPTKEEEFKLKEYKDDSLGKLGPAERFLKAVLDIPFAFKRVDAMLYIVNFDSEVNYLINSFQTLEVASEELRSSRMFFKLLEAVLKTGNRMNVGTNRGDAHAFKLDTLLKLVDVKGTDGKTTLLHFVVQEIIRSEGSRGSSTDQIPRTGETNQPDLREDIEVRKRGLQVVASLSGELSNVKKAAGMDSDVLGSYVSKLAEGVEKIKEVMRLNNASSSQESSQKFSHAMTEFLKKAEEEIARVQAKECVAFSLVKEITEYFHGNSAKEEAHPFRIFMVVRDFLSTLDQVCKDVGKINERTIISSARPFPVPANSTVLSVFPRFHAQQQGSSDDDESSSSSS